MLNDLNKIVLVLATTLLITACGESETPAPTSSESAPAVATPDTLPVLETAPQNGVTESDLDTVPESVPEVAEPEPAPVTTPSEPAVTEPQVAEEPVAETSAPVAETPATPVAEAPAIETPVAPVPESPAATASLDGGQLYNTYCAICHRAGMNAAPKYGSKPLWAKRIAQGRETVYNHAINGLRGMPPRGGFAQLTDDEVKAAVDYMVRAAGGWGDK